MIKMSEQFPYNQDKAHEEALKIQKIKHGLGIETKHENEIFETAEKIAEAKAEIIAVARIENTSQYNKFGVALRQLFEEKKQHLQEVGLKKHLYTDEAAEIGGMKFYSQKEVFSFTFPDEEFTFSLEDLTRYLSIPESFFEKSIQETVGKGMLAPGRTGYFKYFLNRFDALPTNIQLALKNYVDWRNNKAVGANLDACHRIKLVTDQQYDKINESVAKGKLILTSQQPIKLKTVAGKRKWRIEPHAHYWAIADILEK